MFTNHTPPITMTTKTTSALDVDRCPNCETPIEDLEDDTLGTHLLLCDTDAWDRCTAPADKDRYLDDQPH